jgi:hypothetical protein
MASNPYLQSVADAEDLAERVTARATELMGAYLAHRPIDPAAVASGLDRARGAWERVLEKASVLRTLNAQGPDADAARAVAPQIVEKARAYVVDLAHVKAQLEAQHGPLPSSGAAPLALAAGLVALVYVVVRWVL